MSNSDAAAHPPQVTEPPAPDGAGKFSINEDWLAVIVGLALLALVLGGLVLKLVGFDQNASIQTTETLTLLRIADITIPAATAALAIWVMWGYDLSEDRANAIKAELIRRRGVL